MNITRINPLQGIFLTGRKEGENDNLQTYQSLIGYISDQGLTLVLISGKTRINPLQGIFLTTGGWRFPPQIYQYQSLIGYISDDLYDTRKVPKIPRINPLQGIFLTGSSDIGLQKQICINPLQGIFLTEIASRHYRVVDEYQSLIGYISDREKVRCRES